MLLPQPLIVSILILSLLFLKTCCIMLRLLIYNMLSSVYNKTGFIVEHCKLISWHVVCGDCTRLL